MTDMIGRVPQHLTGFDEIWTLYPRKIGKGTARKAYNSALKKTTHAVIKAALVRFAQERAGQDQTYTPHLSTWLNGERWLDEGEPNGNATGSPNNGKGGGGRSPSRPAGERQGGDSIIAAARALTARREGK